MSVNGKELSASEREKEDKRVQKEVEELVKRREKKEQKEERARAKGEKEKKGRRRRRRDQRLPEDQRDHLGSPRDVSRSRGDRVSTFEPRKGFKPKNRAEDIVNKLAGTIWVDETASASRAAGGAADDSYKIAGECSLQLALRRRSASSSKKSAMSLAALFDGGEHLGTGSAVGEIQSQRRTALQRVQKYQIDSKYEF